jgi:hypothetical protein
MTSRKQTFLDLLLLVILDGLSRNPDEHFAVYSA